MPYSEALDSRIIRALSGWGVARKKMFGGTCHLIHGNMMCGVYKDSLVIASWRGRDRKGTERAACNAF